jgi:hypothetical protein
MSRSYGIESFRLEVTSSNCVARPTKTMGSAKRKQNEFRIFRGNAET